MIERIPGKVLPPLVGLLRASARKSQFQLTTSCLRPYPRHFPFSPTRLYASLPTGDPRAPHPADSQSSHQGPSNPPYQQSPQDPGHSLPPGQHFPPPPRPKRSLRPYIYATLFFLIGGLAGQYVRLVVSPPTPPIPGSIEDQIQIASIHKRAAKLPIVQALSEDPDWRSWDAYSTFTPEEKLHRITSGPLGGSRGLGGYQRIFYNASTGEFISVVWLGSALAGWPGVVHGGVTATVMDESMGRCAIARFPVKTGLTAYLEFNYLRPVQTNAFYVVRAVPVPEGSTERKGFVNGWLENIDGRVLVQAKGLFVLPKKLSESSLKPIELKSLDKGF